ncbi:MAG TPA: PIN domain-containing protein [Candidatus Xenobia bacterium]|jgi:hypothetical protein
MITAIDTSVLLDVLLGDPTFGAASVAALRAAIQSGRVVACEVVWAEVSAVFTSSNAVKPAFGALSVEFDSMDVASGIVAGNSWKQYRLAGGKRSRMIADFLIGAHALHQADRLLTRDRGFYRTYFKSLRLVTP